LTTRTLFGNSFNDPVARVSPVEDGPTAVAFYVADRQGSIIGMLGGSGTVAATMTYDGFGNQTSNSNPSFTDQWNENLQRTFLEQSKNANLPNNYATKADFTGPHHLQEALDALKGPYAKLNPGVSIDFFGEFDASNAPQTPLDFDPEDVYDILDELGATK
jgi:hypothetical protein